MTRDKPQPQQVMPRDPALDLIKQQAAEEKALAIQERVGDETTDILRRYGGRIALSGANVGGGTPVKFSMPSLAQGL